MTSIDKEFIEFLNLKGRILDVGSLDINGNIRNYCNGLYLGIDIRKGSNVDVQTSSHNLPFKNESFDNIISIGTLEHDKEFWTSLKEMRRVLRIGGKFIISIPNFKFKYHPYPKDYWRFSIDSINLFFNNEYTIWKSKVDDDCIRAYGTKNFNNNTNI